MEEVRRRSSGEVMDRRRELGADAEGRAVRHLRRRGWQILERNWRLRLGELDIVGLDRKTLVFVEVKAMGRARKVGPDRAVLAVGPEKQDRLARLAAAWMAGPGRNPAMAPCWQDVRFDVIGVEYGGPRTEPSLEHIEDAFRLERSASRYPSGQVRGRR